MQDINKIILNFGEAKPRIYLHIDVIQRTPRYLPGMRLIQKESIDPLELIKNQSFNIKNLYKMNNKLEEENSMLLKKLEYQREMNYLILKLLHEKI